ncbi:phosphatidate cytidylyltransferase [Hymenobacter monticola]|uniref:Phosphatidate cytidylyltransferase n=1 Tax=Hymenobacter monticola TaxID=1705399 RepID=A0ABY4B6N7_9BACT|nr:phosphatidate cytidylyltransferase [Hymenobacter monticola]UOE34680.1 phosphatidate cytidylyltransferase [Hymenobacter monticola]
MADSTPPLSSETNADKTGPSNLQLRITWGIIGAALLLGSVWFSPWTFGLFFAAVQAVMLWEFYRMMRAGGYAPATWIGVGVSTLAFALFHTRQSLTGHLEHIFKPGTQGPSDGYVAITSGSLVSSLTSEAWFICYNALLVIAFLTPVILLLREMRKWPESKQPFADVAVTLLGLLYVTMPMVTLSLLSFNGTGYDYRRIFVLLFLIWASDIGAYAVGRAIGKHKLAPKISPGKTWEGWAGGFVLTLVVGWAIGFMLPDMPLTHRLVAAGVVAVFAPLGDLAESMLKRSVGVKDSGSIMPGHGGLLDRFDAFLLVLPVLALLQLLAG